jgi:transcriptional regulator with XRE-family HTH domain
MEKRESDNATYDSKTLGELVREFRGSYSEEWLANQIGVSRNYISMIENGKSQPSPYRLCQLAVIFKKDIYELAGMTDHPLDKVIKKYNSAFLLQTNANYLICQLETEISSAQTLRESGEPELAKSQLFFWIDHAQKRIESEKDDQKDVRTLSRKLIRAYAVRIVCNNDMQLRGNAVSAATPDFTKLQSLAIKIKDNMGLAIGNTCFAGAFYVDRRFKEAREYALKAVLFLDDNPSFLAETLRGLMIDHAQLDNLKGYRLYETQAFNAIDKGIINSPMDFAAIMEGMGRSKIQFGDLDAINKIQEAEKEMQKLNEYKKNMPLRYLQIHRSRLGYYLKMKSLGHKLDYQIVSEYAQKASNSALSLKDYPRHREEINRLIRCLNIPPIHKPKTNNCQQALLFK